MLKITGTCIALTEKEYKRKDGSGSFTIVTAYLCDDGRPPVQVLYSPDKVTPPKINARVDQPVWVRTYGTIDKVGYQLNAFDPSKTGTSRRDGK